MKNNKIKKLKEQYLNIEIPETIEIKTRSAFIRGMSGMKNKTKIWKRISITCAAVTSISIFALTVNVNPVMADSMEHIPVLGKLVEIMTVKQIGIHEANLEVEANIPSVEGLSDENYQEKLNKEIEGMVQGTIDDAKKEAEERQDGEMPIIVASNYEIKSTENVLSFGIITTQIQASGYEKVAYFNIDLSNNKKLTIKDLFVNNSNYVDIISDNIKNQIKKQMSQDGNIIYFTEEDDIVVDNVFKSINEDQSFYINSDGKLVIAFNEYEIAPGYMGRPEFIIPTELIAECLEDANFIK